MGPRLVASLLVLGSAMALVGCGEGGNAPQDSIANDIKAAHISTSGNNQKGMQQADEGKMKEKAKGDLAPGGASTKP